MSEKHIALGSEFTAKIPFHEIPVNSIYRSSSSPRSLCLKASEDIVVLLQRDNGNKCIEVINHPCGADVILGKLVGVTIDTD